MGCTVMIVDDHPGFRRWCRQLLETEGLTVLGVAADGTSALAGARVHRPDVAIVDVGLPDIDGFQVAERLRHIAPGARVILTSTRSATDYGARVVGSGALGFIPKSEISAASVLALLRD